jgi:transcriptional regulator with XRE-family HTH domain
MKAYNIIGPRVRWLRHQRSWSQNDLAIRLQLLGMEEGTRGRVSKIEARLVWVSDEDMIYLARALKVEVGDLYPEMIRKSSRLDEAIAAAKASRYGVA